MKMDLRNTKDEILKYDETRKVTQVAEEAERCSGYTAPLKYEMIRYRNITKIEL
jgi:hypothetical protein